MSDNAEAYRNGAMTVSTVEIISAETVTAEVRPNEQRQAPPAAKKSKLSLFWGLSGGSILGALGFVALTLYQQYNDSIVELQRDLKHFNTTCADLVKKDDLGHRFKAFWTMAEKLDKTIAEKSERLVLVEHLLKNSEEDRKDLTRELQRLRERLAAVEARQSVTWPHNSSAER